ncbi:MAG TPA: hypothetical protein VHB74_12610 [Devosia sp.]|nr:hypothetical protein [Devosia sp.]
MRKEREALLIAAMMAGLVVVGAAAFVVHPTFAGTSPQVRVIPTQAAALDVKQLAVNRIG